MPLPYHGVSATDLSSQLIGLGDSEESITNSLCSSVADPGSLSASVGFEEDLRHLHLSPNKNNLRNFFSEDINLFEEADYYEDEEYGGKEEEEEEDRGFMKSSVDTMLKNSRGVIPSALAKDNGNLKVAKAQIEIDTSRCSICLDDFDPEDEDGRTSVQGCNHTFCKECLSSYITFKSGDASCIYHTVTLITYEKTGALRVEVLKTYGIPCPGLGCKHVMLINELVPLATKNAIEQFVKFSRVHEEDLQRIKQLNDEEEERLKQEAKSCPRCQSEELKKIKRGRLQCVKCTKPFCGKCGGDHKPSISCKSYRDENLLLFQIKGLIKCPNCRFFTQKMEGCNYMYCRCGQNFCNICGCALDNSKHWSHFDGAPFGDKCKGPKDASKLLSAK